MAMNYAILTSAKGTSGSIRDWVNYDLLPVDDLIVDAEATIYANLRVREMRAMVEVPVALSSATAALPDRFLDPINMVEKLTGASVDQIHEGKLNQMLAYDSAGLLYPGIPTCYAILNEAFNFDVRCQPATTLRLMFYQRPAPLSAIAPTNFLTVRYPNLLRAAVLAHAADFRQDDGNYKRWMQRTVSLLEAANAESDLSRRGSDPGM